MNKFLFILILTSVTLSCGSSKNIEPDIRTTAVTTGREDLQRSTLKLLAFQTIVPMYQQFYNDAAQLNRQVSAFCLKPNRQLLETVKRSWGQTLGSWQQTDALLFGPAIEDQLDFSIYFYPVKKSIINRILNGQNNITVANVEQAGVAGQGLAAIEFLLFDRELSNQNIFEQFLKENGKRRCAYLIAMAILIEQHAQKIYDGWHPALGNYAEAFSRAGLDSLIYTESEQPWAEFTNKIFQSAEKISSSRLAIPLGKKNAPSIKPYKLEAWRSGHTLANILSSLKGLEKLFNDGLLNWLIQNGHRATAEKLTQAFVTINQEKIPQTNLFVLLQSNSNKIESFYQNTRKLTQIIKNDFADAMGVQIGFNDNDGD